MSYRTPKAQTLTEVIHAYIVGDEWKQSINIFVRANCDKFYQVSDYDHEHHALWRTYQEIAESILEMSLESTGGSIESLEKALDEAVSIPSRGPRDDITKEIVDKLMTFDDFDKFSAMMAACAEEDDYGGDDDNGHYGNTSPSNRGGDSPSHSHGGDNSGHMESLLTLGFERDLIEMVLAGSAPDTDLESLVMTLSEMQASDSPRDYRYKTQKHQNDSPSPSSSNTRNMTVDTHATPTRSEAKSAMDNEHDNLSHLRHFAALANVEDVNELHAKFVTARSLLDHFIQGDVSSGVVILVQWASDMVELYTEIEKAHQSGRDMKGPTEKRPDDEQQGLLGWYIELEATRQEADDNKLIGDMLSDTEIKRMAELDKIAETGTEGEQNLHYMITRHDEVQKEINVLHRRCGAMCGPGLDISREKLEELYLYLKGKVNNNGDENGDLTQIADEMHEHVYTMVSGKIGGDVIHILLQMHVLEDEQSILRQKIDAMIGSPTHGAQSKDGGFKEDGADDKESATGGSNMAEAKDNGESKYGDDKKGDEENEEGVRLANALKRKHKQALKDLRDLMDHQKEKKLSDLERRLMRRKLAKEKELNALRNKDDISEEEIQALEQKLRESDAAIHDEINATAAEYDRLKDGICNGFKKKCIYEIKATKEKGSTLSEEELNDAHRDAADALKRRYIENHQQLQSSLDSERAKMKKKIIKDLLKRKKAAHSASEREELERETKEELCNLDESFNDQERKVMSDPQNAILLALSGIYSDMNDMNDINSIKEDEDDLSDDEDGSSKNKKKMELWAEHIMKMRDSFLETGSSIQGHMRNILLSEGGNTMDLEDFSHLMQGVSIDPETGELIGVEFIEGSSDELNAINGHMAKVVTDAFSAHLTDTDNNSSKSSVKLDGMDDNETVRRNILAQFTKSKGDYERSLDQAKASSKEKLAERKAKLALALQRANPSSSSKDDSRWEEKEKLRINKTSNMLERAVDSFLEDPLQFGGKSGGSAYANSYGNKRSVLPSIKKGNGRENEAQSKDEADQAIRVEQKDKIKEKHSQREKELIDALQVEMQRKKTTLRARLERKRKEKAEQDQDAFATEAEIEEDDRIEAEEVEKIESAFDKAVGLLKRTEESRLKGVKVTQLIEVMERFTSPSSEQQSEFKEDEIEKDIKVLLDESNENLAPISHVTQKIKARKNMEEEVSRISSTYNEENQKLDLMMSIQQARQKQSLQRKLLGRRQSMATMGGGGGRGLVGAGFSSDDKTPVRGLGEAANYSLSEVVGTNSAGVSPAMRGFESRGLGTTHMTRK